MQTKTLTYKDEDYDVTLVVRQGRRRDRIRWETERFAKQVPEGDDRLFHLYARDSYAACIAVTEIEGLEIENEEQFLDLPDALVDPWFDAVVELNQHWFPFFSLTRKAVETSTENSASGS